MTATTSGAMTRFVQAPVAPVALTGCTPPTHQAEMKGPQAVGVSPDAPAKRSRSFAAVGARSFTSSNMRATRAG
jgi:hypothetical protein